MQPDPSYHVRLSALPYPGTGRDLGALVERLHSTPLDMASRYGSCTSSRG
ncbi:putative diacylglycerol O-acyltransferase [Mycobacterium tuberculosis]|nr:putative diacylglycerol O-acyltransferase [Mycobacterium tuberculosis]